MSSRQWRPRQLADTGQIFLDSFQQGTAVQERSLEALGWLAHAAPPWPLGLAAEKSGSRRTVGAAETKKGCLGFRTAGKLLRSALEPRRLCRRGRQTGGTSSGARLQWPFRRGEDPDSSPPECSLRGHPA